jgi:hypothetical protein
MSSRAEADRLLNEYIRQLKAPKIFQSKFPNISRTIDPYILHKSDREIYNTLAKDPDGVGLVDWYRMNEDRASKALLNDYYKTKDPNELIKKLKEVDQIDYNIENNPSKENLSGEFDALTDTMYLRPSKNLIDYLDTILHEHQHAKEFNQNPYKYEDMSQVEFRGPINKEKLHKLKENKNLYDFSDEVSTGHFFNPRSSSVNRLIEKSEELGKKEGLERQPDDNLKYSELNNIKQTLKDLEGYSPSVNDIYSKIKSILEK